MKYYESDCVECGLPCKYDLCPHYKVTRFKCDFCNEKDVKLYQYNGWEICESCLLKEHEIVEGSDDWL